MGKLYILFVDNDPHARDRFIQTMGENFTVKCVSTISEAKVCLSVSRPDVLISEVMVGQENGLDLCRYIRSVPALRPLPVMLLTSLATVQDKIAGFSAGTDDYVVKPFDARHLVARIRILTRIKRLERRTNS